MFMLFASALLLFQGGRTCVYRGVPYWLPSVRISSELPFVQPVRAVWGQ